MFEKLLGSGGAQNAMSLIKDPFFKDKIDSIDIHGGAFWTNDPWTWSATIRFRNGNTSARQETKKYKNYDDMVAEIKAILEQLK